MQALRGDAGVSLEEEISWHSALGFSLMDSQWQSIYSSGSGPVVIERAYGKGSIVLAADSYFLSNEALRKERTPKLLSWLVGGSTLVVFDEESHGVRDSPGLASLIAKYGLRGAFAGLLLLAVLFIWKNAAPFIPPFEEADATLVLGKQANEGFVNLLRRSISPQAILGVCAEEWKKSFDHDGSNLKSAHLERVIASEKAKALRQRDTVAAFQTICAEFAPQSSKPKRR